MARYLGRGEGGRGRARIPGNGLPPEVLGEDSTNEGAHCCGCAELAPEEAESEGPKPLGYDIAKLAMDIMSDRGLLAPGEEQAPGMGLFGTAYMWYFGMAIGGGAPNIQRNVIGERGLGLPRDSYAQRSAQ